MCRFQDIVHPHLRSALPCAISLEPDILEGAAMKVIQIEAFGNPAEVVKTVDVPDVGVPAAGEGVIALET